MWNFVASWHRYICFYIQLISIYWLLISLHTIFHAKQCPTDGIKNVYAFLKRSEILPANPAQNFFLHTISLCLHLQIQKEFYVFSSLFFVFFFLALNLIAYHFADGIKRKNMVLLGFSSGVLLLGRTEISSASAQHGLCLLAVRLIDWSVPGKRTE